jgi:hypothetical protein
MKLDVKQRYGSNTEKGEHWSLLEFAPWKQLEPSPRATSRSFSMRTKLVMLFSK